jgi:uncharacterized protein YyaL (SSP411 family)
VAALSGAISQAEKARSDKAMVAADGKIAAAASSVYEKLLPLMTTARDKDYIAAAWDELVSVNYQIGRHKRAYNAGLQEAIEVYAKLPARWILQNPEGEQI